MLIRILRFAAIALGGVMMVVSSVGALDDPTRPPGASGSAEARLQPERQFMLSSVMIGEQRRTAVIDGVPRRIGDVFEGVRVRAIRPGGVELVVNGEVRILRLEALPAIRSVQ